jgi:hypothetical protein
MRIIPSDLPLDWNIKVIQRRHNPAVPVPGDPPQPRLGFLGRFWAGATQLTEERAAALAPIAGIASNAVIWTLGGLGTMFGIIAAAESRQFWMFPAVAGLGWGVGASLAPSIFRAVVERPLGAAEIELLQQWAKTDLDREFLSLISDLTRLKVSAADEAPLRAALADLSVAVTSLPDMDLTPADPDALRREANEVDAQAAGETDRPTAESLARRAQALRRQADAAEQAGLLLRRTQAVRAEVQTHIASLRTGLAALRADSSDTVGLAALAESARAVAQEAAHMATARVELAQVVGAWPATPVEGAESTVLRAGRQG